MKRIFNLFFLATLMLIIEGNTTFAQFKSSCANGKTHQKLKKSRSTPFANQLMSQYDVHYYFLTLEVQNNSLFINGNTLIEATVTSSQVDTFCFELQANHTIDSILYNGVSIPFQRTGDLGLALLPSPALLNANLKLKIYYQGTAQNTILSASDFGFNTAFDSIGMTNVTWSLSEPFSAYDWFPCKQFLEDKADSSRVHIITSDSNKAGSNGVLIGIDNLPGNKVMCKWFNKHPIDYYLISIAVANYFDYSYYSYLVSGDSLLVQNYIYKDSISFTLLKEQFDQTDSMIRYMDSLLIPYPFKDQKYGHCVVASEYSAMEHQTMSSIGTSSAFYLTIAHELAHQWFGDLVTCKTWKDIYLNEGLTSYIEYLVLRNLIDTAFANQFMQFYHDDITNLPGGSVYCPDTTDVSRIFDGRLTYEKGAAVTHTLRYILGDSVFYSILRAYLNTYKNSTANIQNFKTIAETISGKNLNNFFNEWIYGEGFPIYNLKYNSTGNFIGIVVIHTPSTPITPLFTTPLQLLLSSSSGDTLVELNITTNSDTFWIPSTKIINNIIIDPNNWIINKVGFRQKINDLFPTSITDLVIDHSIKIWPNPIYDGQLNLDFDCASNARVEIIDLKGQVVFSSSFSRQLDISVLHSAIYLIKVSDDHGIVMTQKIEKK